MEITLIFLFLLFSIFLILLAYLFEAKLFLLGSSLIFILLALNVLQGGYQTQETTSAQTQLGYFFNSTINQNVLTQLNTSSMKQYSSTQDSLSQTFGFLIFFVGIIIGFIGAFNK
jgi:hypothetical protein